MEKPTHLIDFETMLLGRHVHHNSPRPRRSGGRLDSSAYVLLSRIAIEGPLSIGQLSDALGLDTSTLHRQTTSMLGDGLLERIPDPDGGMARKFRITEEGQALLDAERSGSVEALDKLMEDWTPEDVAAFAAYLERFNTDIERMSGRPWPRP
ncbi:DNA-binding MarR family transcriptional regulator [Rhodococcus sp. OK519]|uniref:MarR family winged helix-turn-helix transcriptional regulator n=1 Tax=Rhodococcus sp. OK519 TaxID=2135729 RepID=UPI000D3CDE61|nr:DNA-binding MarR family transcriptional regulator [Rhodococcus sp. OK519]